MLILLFLDFLLTIFFYIQENIIQGKIPYVIVE